MTEDEIGVPAFIAGTPSSLCEIVGGSGRNACAHRAENHRVPDAMLEHFALESVERPALRPDVS